MRKILWLDETHETETGYQVNVVTENQSGYLPTSLRLDMSFGQAKAYVDQLNKVLFDIDKDDANEIIISSMFGAGISLRKV